ncbi:MAG: aldo/keto reductase, partial [Verrucomicrobiaceae bacterium]
APTPAQICTMLEEAAAAGINCLDTARSYEGSEQALGNALEETGLREHFLIVTKTSTRIPVNLSDSESLAAIRQSLEQSLRHLRCERPPVVLLHRDGNAAHLAALATCRAAGLAQLCGVSLTNPASAGNFLLHPHLGAIQAPVNALDTRFNAITRAAGDRGSLVFARSCYLQGLLLMTDEATPPHLLGVKPARDFLRQLADQQSLSLSELLLRAMLSRNDINSVVVGMENLDQLRDNLRIFSTPPLPTDIIRKIEGHRADFPAWLVDPFQWDSHKADGIESRAE